MATKSYDDYEVEQLAKAKQKTAEYEQVRRQQAAAAASKVADSYNSAIKQAEGQYKQSAVDTEESYRSAYDANVINELVARRNATEAIANAGAVNSGLNTTQQTAISLMRGNADHNTTQQKQAAVDAIMRELDNVRADYVRQSAAEQNAIYNEADADVLKTAADNDAAAQDIAMTLYTQAKDDEQAAADRAWEEYLINVKYQNEAAADAAQRQWQSSEAAADRQHEASESAADREHEKNESAADRDWKSKENAINREHAIYKQYLQFMAQSTGELRDVSVSSVDADDNTYSLFAIELNAKTVQKERGDVFVEQYLTQCVNNEFITEEQKTELLQKVGVRQHTPLTIAQVRAISKRIQQYDGTEAACDHVKFLYDSGMIGIRVAEMMYDELGA